MTKKPQGVYVNELTHNRVTTLVENALDGHGSLAGFVAFLEDALVAATDDEMILYSQSEGNRIFPSELMRDAGRMNRFDYAPKDGFGAAPREGRNAVEAAQASLKAYEDAWKGLAEALPWDEADARSHIAALFLLRDDPRVWRYDSAYDSPRARHYSLATALGWLMDIRYPDRHHPLPVDDEQEGPVEVTLLWRGGAVEVLLEPAKNRSTSFYLDSEAHDLAVRVFGRDLFDRVERGLHRLLATHHHFLALEPQFNFLEHGPALVDYQWGDLGVRETEEDLKELWRTQVFEFLRKERSQVGIKGIREGRGFGPYLTRFQNTLPLAAELGLIESPSDVDDKERRKSGLLPAFLERYSLEGLAPERGLAYQVIRDAKIPTDRTFVTNAVDYHLLRLFQEYALSVLPPEQREKRRVHPMTLATLAQPWVLATRTTLEAWGNVKATKTPAGVWQLASGRSVVLELSDSEAYWVAKTLNAVLSMQPVPTESRRLAGLRYEEESTNPMKSTSDYDFTQHWARAALEVGAGRRIKIPLGVEVLKRALEAVREAGEQLEPVAIGLQLTAQLTDDSIEANGKFAEAFLKRAAVYLGKVPRKQRGGP